MASDVLEKIKKAFKKLSGEETDSGSVNSESPSGEPLIAALREMDAAYRAEKSNVDLSDPDEQYPESLGLVPKSYVQKTDAEIAAQAEETAQSKNIASLGKAQEAYAKAESAYEAAEEELEDKEKNSKQDLVAKTNAALKKHRDNMIYQGLVNSTVNTYGQAQITAEYGESLERIESEYDSKYAKIKSELTQAEQKYNNALREYDISYATDLRNAIDKLKESELKRIAEINEYNRSIAEKEARYVSERESALRALRKQRNADLLAEAKAEAEYEEANGVTPDKQAEYDKRLEIARQFYSGYTRAEANQMIYSSGDILSALLGKENYATLVAEMMARSE